MTKDELRESYGDQLNRAASGAAANYRAALRGKSTADFINKFKIVEEELDESLFFFELIEAVDASKKGDIYPLYKEVNELLSIIVSSLITLRSKK